MKALIMNLLSLSLLSNSDNFSNVETFITSFDFVENANAEIMITNLANRSLSHFLINNLHISMNDQTSHDLQIDLNVQIDLKMINFSDLVHISMKNIDSFTYMIIDRYTSEVFYDIMIDSEISTRSTTEYDQYLAVKKNSTDSSADLNSVRADAVNVQFEIESILSLRSMIIDISIELMKIHVIKTDTSFLLSLADMNRLKVYFNNIENILFMITKNRSLSVI
jgi:hypothetical protein